MEDSLHFLKKIEAQLFSFLKLETPVGGDDILDNLYLDLHKAILCGEFYHPESFKFANNIEDHLRNFIDKYKIKEIPEDELLVTDELGIEKTVEFGAYDFTNDELSRKFEKKIRYLNQFKELSNNVNVIQNYFNKGKKIPVIDLNVFKSYAIKLDISEILADEIINDISEVFYDSLFQINLLLAYIDEYLECDETTIIELQRIKLFLKAEYRNNINGEVFDILVSKVNFLSYKIEYRLNRKTSFSKLILEKNNHFYLFSEKLKLHYEEATQELATQYENELNEYFEQKKGEFEIYKIHYLCRFYRKIEDSTLEFRLNKLEDLRELLRTVTIEKNNFYKFDHIALDSVSNLLENAILWIKLEQEIELEFPSIIDAIKGYIAGDTVKYECEYLIILLTQLDTYTRTGNIPDYYGYKIVLDFIDKLLDYLRDHASEIANSKEKIIDQKSADVATLRVRNIIDSLLKVHIKAVNALKVNFKDIRHLEVRPIYLTYRESFVPIQWLDKKDLGASLFLDSSYTLPNNFDYIKKDIDYWSLYYHKGKLRALKNRFEAEIGKIVMSSKAESFEKKMQENEFKTVQIVALFVTVATFVFSTIKIFETKNGVESFGILIGMAACFILFNSAFNWLIQWQIHRERVEKKAIMLALFYMVLVGGLLGLSFYILNKEDNEKNNQNNESNKIKVDSIYKKGDTLIFYKFMESDSLVADN